MRASPPPSCHREHNCILRGNSRHPAPMGPLHLTTNTRRAHVPLCTGNTIKPITTNTTTSRDGSRETTPPVPVAATIAAPHRLKLPPTSTRTGRCCRRLRRPALATAGRCPHLTRASCARSCARSGRRRPWPRLLAPFAPHEPAAATAARVVHCGSPPPDLLAAQPPDLGELGLDP